MGSKPQKHIGIVGAGIAGLTAAIMLQKQGYRISVFESSKNVSGVGAGIGLASNAMKAFEYLGLASGIKEISNPLKDFRVCDAKGDKLFAIDTNRIQENYRAGNYAVHRGDLHQYLINQIDSEYIFSDKKLISLKLHKEKVNLKFEDRSQTEVDYVIGADGVNSRVRQILLPEAKPRYAGYWCWRGVVKYTKKDPHKSMALWGKNGRFGITSIARDTVYWFACINSPLDGEIADFGLKDLQKQFQNYHPLVQELLSVSKAEEIISGPIMDVKPLFQFKFSRMLLIGDAAHATTPNMGQGACMALEDVAVFQDELQQHDFKKACFNFQLRRLDRTKYITVNSRRAGKIAQLDNSLLIFLRNNLFRILPEKLTQLPVKRLYEEDFMKI
ncbi:MAG TPA: FAD-dependent monooxygenase [Flavobacteriaceae bacterium]|nr:FAD-dependent monooxygenase [Flavobacteriaceae bacterium]